VSLALLLLSLLGADAIALKDKASVGGRWVRVIDLVDADRSDAAARLRLADVYLGRAPEEGKTRTVTLDEIRAEVQRRGLDPASFVWHGDRVEVTAGPAAASEPLRLAIAEAIRRQTPDVTGVRIVQLRPETSPEGVLVADVKPRGPGFVATLSNGAKVDVVVKLSRPRDAVFAARDLLPGRVIDRADLEIQRVEMADDEPAADLALIVGAAPATRIRPGSAITAGDLRLKAIVKKGDVVRAVSAGYEVDARALEDGATGQEIRLEFVSSRNRLRAKVASAARVDVVEAAR
jgi:flagella basal body P-ring formation protein FlgA